MVGIQRELPQPNVAARTSSSGLIGDRRIAYERVEGALSVADAVRYAPAARHQLERGYAHVFHANIDDALMCDPQLPPGESEAKRRNANTIIQQATGALDYLNRLRRTVETRQLHGYLQEIAASEKAEIIPGFFNRERKVQVHGLEMKDNGYNLGYALAEKYEEPDSPRSHHDEINVALDRIDDLHKLVPTLRRANWVEFCDTFCEALMHVPDTQWPHDISRLNIFIDRIGNATTKLIAADAFEQSLVNFHLLAPPDRMQQIARHVDHMLAAIRPPSPETDSEAESEASDEEASSESTAPARRATRADHDTASSSYDTSSGGEHSSETAASLATPRVVITLGPEARNVRRRYAGDAEERV